MLQQADVLGEQGHQHLEDEPLRQGAVHLAGDQLVEAGGQPVGGLAGDGLLVVAEGGLLAVGKQERQRPVAPRQVLDRELIDRRVHLGLEVVDPELVEVAEDDVARPAGHQAGPVVERLAVMAPQVLAAAFHLDQHDRLPDQIGEGGAAGVGLLDPLLADGPRLFDTLEPERLKEAVEEDLGLALLVAGDVLLDPGGEVGELLFACFVHLRGAKHGVQARRLNGPSSRLAGEFTRRVWRWQSPPPAATALTD